MSLDDMSFKTSQANPDVWVWLGEKPDGEECYQYILVYVDDILAISHVPVIMDHKQRYFRFKDNKVEPPEIYLGSKLKKEPWTFWMLDYF